MNKTHDIIIDRTKLHPWLNYKLTLLLKQCAKKRIYLIITQGFRSKAQQDELYAQGRTKKGNIVTNAKGSDYSVIGLALWILRIFIWESGEILRLS